MINKTEWFDEWFDSPYYHLLYQNRNENEADSFIKLLCNTLSLPLGSSILDLACGLGRHAKIFNTLGFNTFGADLSKNSINIAKKMENEKLHFFVHDMRNKLPLENLNMISNLFTSFGYFDDINENKKVLDNIYSSLTNDGLFVLDFMNVIKVMSSLPSYETKLISNIEFKIKKYYDSRHIYKEIKFSDLNKDFFYTEKVQNITYNSFENLLTLSNFKIIKVFGSYELCPFDENKSDRLIIIAKK